MTQPLEVRMEMAIPKRELLALQIMPMLMQTALFQRGQSNLTDQHFAEIIKKALNIADLFLKEIIE